MSKRAYVKNQVGDYWQIEMAQPAGFMPFIWQLHEDGYLKMGDYDDGYFLRDNVTLKLMGTSFAIRVDGEERIKIPLNCVIGCNIDFFAETMSIRMKDGFDLFFEIEDLMGVAG